MPFYDYECPQCGWVEEIAHGMGEGLTFQCPNHDPGLETMMVRKYTPPALDAQACPTRFGKEQL